MARWRLAAQLVRRVGVRCGKISAPKGAHARRAGESGNMQSMMVLAEGVGFEPTVRFHAHTLSKRAP